MLLCARDELVHIFHLYLLARDRVLTNRQSKTDFGLISVYYLFVNSVNMHKSGMLRKELYLFEMKQPGEYLILFSVGIKKSTAEEYGFLRS